MGAKTTKPIGASSGMRRRNQDNFPRQHRFNRPFPKEMRAKMASKLHDMMHHTPFSKG